MSIRFGLMTVPFSGRAWAETARTAEQQGYHTLLMPDTLNTPSPFPAFAAAAAVTETLRLRPNVIAAPLRTAAATVRETAALQRLSEDRFELGIGIGRPDAASEAERLGQPWGSAASRRAHLTEVVAAVRAEVDPAPPIMIATSGPRMLALAAQIADRIALAAGPQATEDDLATMIALARDNTDRPIAFTTQLMAIGDRMPRWPGSWNIPTADNLRAASSAAALPADPAEAAAILEHRHEKYGIDEVIVPSDIADAFTPIMERLR
ncbi:LLM class flavin-dependent oxidoreductase [Nocardia pseudobrasiliensis]|uniref:Luciferase-like monooxygenase n=1 Tax=Nocardia pseudobrasiliensis TaxID=45979 RepID=A0A370I5S0_9NOCA|nr:LLM class flavin-dependent oxidoreductase [Nocardia pseudobrasiliensis]RDI66085.1 luciferase-like monooxygenase [Nocardia pseudobrasiliensis]